MEKYMSPDILRLLQENMNYFRKFPSSQIIGADVLHVQLWK